jgi:hypothetical protein
MSTELQSYTALAVFVLAVGYLTLRWWQKRKRSQAGCGNSDECACPTPKLSGTRSPSNQR